MTNTVSAKQLDPTKPQYIVLFKRTSENNVRTLSSVLNCQKTTGISSRSGVEVLANPSGRTTKVYERLAASTTDLTNEEYDLLKGNDDVEDIFENEVRYLPPVNKSLESEDEARPSGGNRDPFLAYLQGMRDAANLAIAYYEGRQNCQSGSQEASVSSMGNMELAAVNSTWGLRAVGVAPNFSLSGRGIRVAVLDTGIDLNHPDLRGKVIEGVSAVSFVSGVTVQDVNGHGTHCAGTISGPRTSVGGLRYGVAPDVELLVGKVFNNNSRPSATDDDILEGIDWAAEKGAKIISMSLGSGRSVGGAFPPAYEKIAKKLLDKDQNSVLIVAAAGNASDRPFSTAPVENPAACPSIVAVAAVDSSLRVASFSCRQMDSIGEVNISGPGVSVYSSYIGGTFERLSGTSMATPHVAGVAALYLERSPNLTARQLFQELRNRVRVLGNSADFGAGLVRL